MMKEHRLLKVLDWIRFIYRPLGVDYEVVRKLLNVRLIMDERRSPAAVANAKKETKGNRMLGMYILYAMMGGVAGIILYSGLDLFYKMNAIFGIMMFMVGMTLIADFSAVLLDFRDKSILMSRPVDSRAVNAAKMTHILYYLLKITFSFALIPLAVSLFKYGVFFFLLFAVLSICVAGFLLFVTSILYFVILQIFDGEKLKDIINNFQIVLSLLMAVSYQFMGNLFIIVGRTTVVFKPVWWAVLIPSTWFSAPFCLLTGQLVGTMIPYTVIGLAVTVLSVFLYFRVITPYFERNLQKLSDHRSEGNANGQKRKKIEHAISQFICRDKDENTFYRFTRNMISQERALKLRIYPSIGLGIVLPLIVFVRTMDWSSAGEMLSEIPKHTYYLNMYMTIWMLAIVSVTLRFSDSYKGAWVFRTMPVSLNAAYRGAFKGFFVKIMLPAFLAVSAVFLMLYGIRILMDVAIILLVLVLLSMAIYRICVSEPPFCIPPQSAGDSSSSKTVVAILVGGAVSGLMAGLHYLIRSSMLFRGIEMVLLVIAIFLFWSTQFKLTWKAVEQSVLNEM